MANNINAISSSKSPMNSVESDCYDVVIVGAGMSGALLALAILKKNAQLNVLLLDENPERLDDAANLTSSSLNPSFDARCIALNAGSVDILNDLSLWESIKGDAQAIKKIQVSDRGYFGAAELTPNVASIAFGYVVELRHVGRVLVKALSAYSTLTTLHNVKLDKLEQTPDLVSCQLSNGEYIKAKLCVGADGTDSKVRALANINESTNDYQRSAVICNVRCSQPHYSIAYERFTKNGPIALLPLTDERYSLVYCIENEHVNTIQELSEDAFLLHLQQQFGYRAGIFEKAGKRDVYPLSLVKSNRPIGHRIACIGNAAHSLHPVAGQGFNLGLRDLFVLATAIVETKQADIGSFSMLKRYWQCRESDHNKTISMTDGLVRLFSNEYPLLSVPRNIGLQAISLFPGFSAPIIEQAKGQFELFERE